MRHGPCIQMHLRDAQSWMYAFNLNVFFGTTAAQHESDVQLG